MSADRIQQLPRERVRYLRDDNGGLRPGEFEIIEPAPSQDELDLIRAEGEGMSWAHHNESEAT